MAYGTYVAVVIHFTPQKGQEMAAHPARDKLGEAWLRYEQAFRQVAATCPDLQWDRRDMDTWVSAESAPEAS